MSAAAASPVVELVGFLVGGFLLSAAPFVIAGIIGLVLALAATLIVGAVVLVGYATWSMTSWFIVPVATFLALAVYRCVQIGVLIGLLTIFYKGGLWLLTG